MASIEVNKDNVKSILEGNKYVVLDFWASWCGPCKTIAPIFTAVSEEYPNVVFGKVDVEANPGMIETFGVKSIPFICGIREQYVVMEIPGMMKKETLRKIVEHTINVDLEKLIEETNKKQK